MLEAGSTVIPRLTVTLFASLLLSSPSRSQAQSASETYLAARDRYITAAAARDAASDAKYREISKAKGYIAAHEFLTEESAKQEPDLNDLESRLNRLMGPFVLEGYPDTGKINLETLNPELGFGKLDGLTYVSVDKNTTILVTTRELLIDWLKTQSEWAGPFPQDVRGVLGKEQFYTYATGPDDMRSVDLGDIPVAAPAGATYASAMLASWTADSVNAAPDMILASVARGDRIFVLSQRLGIKLKAEPTCDRLWNESVNSSKADNADGEYQRCFAKRVLKQSRFRTVIQQAQTLINRLPPQPIRRQR
jgi:hypothetical protein